MFLAISFGGRTVVRDGTMELQMCLAQQAAGLLLLLLHGILSQTVMVICSSNFSGYSSYTKHHT
jgi:hypothetical protein